MNQKIAKNFDSLRWRLIVFFAIVAVFGLFFTLLMLKLLGPVEPLAMLLASKGEFQKPFHWFHLMWWGILILVTFLLLKFASHVDERSYRLIIFVGWFIIFVLELIGQFTYFYYYDKGVLTEAYRWNRFPFQFCSLPFYILPFVFLLNDGKLRDTMENFSIVFMVFAGLANYFYPVPVFNDIIYVNIHTMIHHGAMIAMAIYIAYYRRVKLTLKQFLPSIIVFVATVLIAVVINESTYQCLPEVRSGVDGQVVNMFYISSHFPTVIPILKQIQPFMPNPVFIILYIIGFSLMAYLMLLAFSLIFNHKIKPCLPLKENLFPKLNKK
ncbi:MAG: YwaF family protein [Bacilli bacterium]|nr:YwaF family protein [Bacilli bacterium]